MEVNEISSPLVSLPNTPPSTPILTNISPNYDTYKELTKDWLIIQPNINKLIKQYHKYFNIDNEDKHLHDDILHIISSFASGPNLAKMAMISKVSILFQN